MATPVKGSTERSSITEDIIISSRMQFLNSFPSVAIRCCTIGCASPGVSANTFGSTHSFLLKSVIASKACDAVPSESQHLLEHLKCRYVPLESRHGVVVTIEILARSSAASLIDVSDIPAIGEQNRSIEIRK